MGLKYENISSVVELANAEKTREYLNLGWILLETLPHENGPYSQILYSLGWPRENGEPKLPDGKFPNVLD